MWYAPLYAFIFISNKDLTLQFVSISSNNCISFKPFSFGLLEYLICASLILSNSSLRSGENICLVSLSICIPLHQENFRFSRLSDKLDILYSFLWQLNGSESLFTAIYFIKDKTHSAFVWFLVNFFRHKSLKANKETQTEMFIQTFGGN